MIKIDIFSGFLGAGKTTLIKKLIGEAYSGEKLVLIENEFGDIGIDGEFLKDAGVQINELNSGCICCSLVGDFSKALVQVINDYSPDRIIIEPSGVGKLSDVIRAVEGVDDCDIEINGLTAIVDAGKCKMYMKNFGEFFNDQIENAGCIILSHTDNISEEKLSVALELIKEHNDEAVIITTPWDKLNGVEILEAIEGKDTLENTLEKLIHEDECPVCGGHHEHHHDHECCGHEHHHDHDHECCGHEHHHEHDHECCCGHEHNHDHDHECCGHDHHHEHDHECCCGHEHNHDHDHECCGHEHHHEHDHECCCGHEHNHDHDHECCEHEHNHDHDCCCGHDHHHDHHHHADDIFTSWGTETVKKYTKEEITEILKALENEEEYGIILRAKGIVSSNDDEWIHFDYVPGEPDVRYGAAAVCGRLCVIGSGINEEKIKKLFAC